MLLILVALFCFFLNDPLIAFSVTSKPICKVKTVNSILENPEPYKAAPVGDRERHATCTGAGWFQNNHLVTANLYGSKLLTYTFDETKNKFHLMQEITQEDMPLFDQLEALSVSPDQTMLALISNTRSKSHLFLFSINDNTYEIDAKPILIFETKGFLHNVRFSPTNSYIALASFNNEHAITIYQLSNNGSYSLNLISTLKNQHPLIKTKAVNFTSNGKYILVAYALGITSSKEYPIQSCLDVFEFDTQNGHIGNQICSIPGAFSFEDLTLLDDDHILALPDQAHDKIIFYHFDPTTGEIDPHYFSLENPDAELSFPHGVATSPNGRYLVATNYGTDTFNLYQIE